MALWSIRGGGSASSRDGNSITAAARFPAPESDLRMNTGSDPLNPRTISRDHLRQMMDRKMSFALIDVLDAEEFNESHLPDAVNIPWDDTFNSTVTAAFPDKNRKIVVYCAGPTCDASTLAARALASLGYMRVRDFKGGAQAWRDAEQRIAAANLAAPVVPLSTSPN